jgi:hypothetical protein
MNAIPADVDQIDPLVADLGSIQSNAPNEYMTYGGSYFTPPTRRPLRSRFTDAVYIVLVACQEGGQPYLSDALPCTSSAVPSS